MARPETATTRVRIEQDGSVGRVGGTLDFDTAREALGRVSSLIADGRVSRVDLGGVERSNSAGLALMVEWLAVARLAGRALVFENVPDELVQLAVVCQVDALVGRPPHGAPSGDAATSRGAGA